MKHWMFRCDDVFKKVSRGMDDQLPVFTRLAIRFHMWMCAHCSQSHKQMYLLRKISRHDLDDGIDSECPPELPRNLSPEARERIKSELRCKRNDGPR